jgi:hypothetical protein
MIKNEPEKSHRVAQGFMRESNGIPGACFLDLLALQKNQSSRYDVRLQEYAKKYPDYHMIRMIQTIDKVLDQQDEHLLHDIPASRETFFPGITAIHTIEFDHFLMLQFALAQQEDDLSKLSALHAFLAEFSMQTLMVRYVRAMIVMKMYRHILQHYKHES